MRNLRGRFGFGSVAVVAGLGLLSGACSDADKGNESAAEVISELRSDAPRVTPDFTEATAAAQGEQQFATSFLHALDADRNLAFSPHSLSTAFAMLTDAAQGKTLEEVEQVLYFGKADEAFHRSQDALQLGLAARNREAVKTDTRTVDAQTLSESNDIWVRDDVPPTPSYLDTLARYYGVGIHQADFSSHPQEARAAINAKISDDTHALIPELLPHDSITLDTVAVPRTRCTSRPRGRRRSDRPSQASFSTWTAHSATHRCCGSPPSSTTTLVTASYPYRCPTTAESFKCS